LKKNKTPFVKIGVVKGKNLEITDNENNLINQKIDTLKDLWKNTIWNIMG